VVGRASLLGVRARGRKRKTAVADADAPCFFSSRVRTGGNMIFFSVLCFFFLVNFFSCERDVEFEPREEMDYKTYTQAGKLRVMMEQVARYAPLVRTLGSACNSQNSPN
jgi:hypothetical protein